MGQDYEYGDLEDMDGTSFAAPQVAGMIAQLCDIYPYLLDNPLLVKAMLMSGASYLANIAAMVYNKGRHEKKDEDTI